MAGWLFLAVAVGAFVLGNIRDDEPPARSPSPPPAAAPHLELEVVGGLRSGQEARFRIVYVNPGAPVDVVFGSGQDGEVVLIQGGVTRWRWSDGMAFSQVVRPVRLGSGRTDFVLAGRPLDLVPGEYVAIASLAAQPAPPPVRLTVTVD